MFTFDWKCRWELINIYFNLRKMIEMSTMIVFVTVILSLVFRDYFILMSIPMWFGILFFSVVVRWFKTIKPESLEIANRIVLIEKHKFMHKRFMKQYRQWAGNERRIRMIIDENLIESLLQKEVKQQVEAKLKSFGRDAIKGVYENAVRDSVSEYIREKESELIKDIELNIKYNTYEWNKEIVDRVAVELTESISEGLQRYKDHY